AGGAGRAAGRRRGTRRHGGRAERRGLGGGAVSGSLAMRRGLTLAELVLSLMVVTLVMGAATSAVLLVTRAAPASAGEAAAAGAAAEALHRIGVELRYATALTRQHARRPAFLVADRGHGAAGPEQIEYEWSG